MTRTKDAAKATDPTMLQRLWKGFVNTKEGRAVLTAAQEDERNLEERRKARERLDASEDERKSLPKLEAAVKEAEKALEEATGSLRAKVRTARQAFNQAAEGSGFQHGRATAWLRNTADPLVHDNGPVVQAIQNDRLHLRTHTLGTSDEMVRRVAKFKPPSTAIEDTGPVERAKLEVLLADASLERIDALDQALDDLRELALEVEVDPAAVRDIVAACPTVCECGQALTIGTVFASTSTEGVPA